MLRLLLLATTGLSMGQEPASDTTSLNAAVREELAARDGATQPGSAGSGEGFGVWTQRADTGGLVFELRTEIGEHYSQDAGSFGTMTHAELADWFGWRCDGSEAQCFGGDWDSAPCPANEHCTPEAVSPALTLAWSDPEAAGSSGFSLGQSVHALVKLGQQGQALQLLDRCVVSAWWCAALEVLVLQSAGSVDAAEAELLVLQSSAPRDEVCRLLDATWLLGRLPLRRPAPATPLPTTYDRWSELGCDARSAASDSIFWLADPLYVVEGNDRRTEHVTRGLLRVLSQEIWDARPTQATPRATQRTLWAEVIRRGPRDSWEVPRVPPRATSFYFWTSRAAARYHFVPDFDGTNLSKPTWSLNGDMENEGYTPSYAPFYALPLQIARFRASADTMQRVASAGLVTGSEIEDAAESGYLVFTDAPESFPLQLEAPFHDGRAVYLAEAETKPHAVSFEVLTSAGIGWHREWVEPLNTAGPGLSDVLLYRPTGMAEPDSLLAAAALMHGTTSLQPAELGLYWELYDVSAETPIEFALEARKADGGGLISSLRRLLPGRGQEEGTGQLAWVEPSNGVLHPRAIILDLRNLDDGEYDLLLKARWDGGEVESARRIEVR